MSERNFSMRMKCAYQGDGNTVVSLAVEHRVNGEWQPLQLGTGAPGFDIFIYALFACQHQYFRVNSAERGLLLESATGSIEVGAGSDWKMETVRIGFSAQLRSGQAGRDDIEHIVSRMQQCPVSINLGVIPDSESTVTLDELSATARHG